MRKIFLLLLLVSFVLAAPPDWVKQGVKITYTATPGGDVSYEVLSVSATEVKIDQSPGGAPTDNASADSGSFWYDKSKTSTLSQDDSIDGWKIFEKDVVVTAAGKSWVTLKMKKTLFGQKTERWVEKETGLLIKQAIPSQTVLLKSINPPFGSESATPVPSPILSGTPQPQPSPSDDLPPLPSDGQPSPTPSPQPSGQPTPSNTSAPSPAPAPGPVPDLKPPDSNVPCCPIAFMLLILGFVVYRHKN